MTRPITDRRAIQLAAREVRDHYERQMDEAVQLGRLIAARDWSEQAASLTELLLAPTLASQLAAMGDHDLSTGTISHVLAIARRIAGRDNIVRPDRIRFGATTTV